MRIAICDDEQADIDLLKGYIKIHNLKHEVAEFLSPEPFFDRIGNGERFDLLFLDIMMPGADGWEIAKHLKDIKSKIYIAMVTILGDRIHDCFDRVDWFAPKPLELASAHKILNNAQDKLFPAVFCIEDGRQSIVLTAPEIIYVEVKHNDCFIHTAKGKEPIRLRKSIEAIKSDLNMPCFAQPHRSYIVNLSYCRKKNANDILLKNDKAIPISKNMRSEFGKSLREHVKAGVLLDE